LRVTTDTSTPDRWWFDFEPDWFEGNDDLAGTIFLCRSGERLFDFGFAAASLRALAPACWVPRDKSLVHFAIVRHGGRFFLKQRGRELDVSARLGDVSWLNPGAPGSRLASPSPSESLPPTTGATGAAEASPSYGQSQPSVETLRCFARFADGVLHPLDPIPALEGAVFHVVATPAPIVPANAALRRIVARGAGEALPADFAIEHDHYIHGTPRR